MANPIITVEIKAVGRKDAVDEINKVSDAARAASRAKARLADQAGRTGRAFKTSGAEAGRFTKIMRDLETSTILAAGPLSGIGARIRAIGVLSRSGSLALAGLAAGIIAVVAVFGILSAKTIATERDMQRFEGRLNAVTGAIILSRNEISHITDIVRKFGLDIKSALSGFSQLAAAARGTALEGEGIRKVFEGASAAIASLRLPAQQAEGVFRALEQMLTKGVVRAEEWNQQLGDQLPGATILGAKALKVIPQVFQQMLRNGEILTEDFFPKLAQALLDVYGPQAQENVNSLQGATNRLNTAFFEFFNTIEDNLHIAQLFANILNTIADAVETLTDALKTPASEAKRFVSEFNSSLEQLQIGGILKSRQQELLAEGQRILGELDSQIAEVARSIDSIRTPLAEKAFGDMKSVREELQKALEAIKGLPIRQLGSQGGAALDTKALDRLRRNFEKLRDTVETGWGNLTDQLNNNFDSILQRTSRLEAANFLRNFKPEVVQAFAQELAKMNIITEGTVASLTDWIAGTLKLRDVQKQLSGIFSESITPVQEYNNQMKLLDIFATSTGTSLDKLGDVVANLRRNLAEGLGGREFLKSFSPEQMQAVSGRLGIPVDELKAVAAQGPSTTQALRDIAEIFDQSRTPLEAYRMEMDRLIELKEKWPEFADAIQTAMNNTTAAFLEADPFIGPLIDGFHSIGDAIADMVKKGEVSLQSLLDIVTDVFTQILQQAIKLMIINPLLNSIFGLSGAGGFPTAGGSIFGAIPTNILGLPGFQHGGEGMVGGSGGTDSKLVQFRATPGERVKVETPSQQKAADQKQGDSFSLVQNNFFGSQSDPRREFRRAAPTIAGDFAAIVSKSKAKS